MQIKAELEKNHILIKKSKDVGRLYNKSLFGETQTGNILKINLIEGMFLLDEQKMILYKNKEKIDFPTLFKIAAAKIPEFETKYLTFRDLRKRGQMIKLNEKTPEITYTSINKQEKKPSFIATYSERKKLIYQDITKLIKSIKKQDGNLWFSIVDEEGDITYYEVLDIELKGQNIENKYQKTTGTLLENRVVIFDKTITSELFEKEFYGKPFGEGLQLSLVEALYLLEKNILKIQDKKEKNIPKNELLKLIKKQQPDIQMRLQVFKDLKNHGLIIKTGFKFGSHFRVYTKNPEEIHAEYLVHVVDKNYTSSCAELSRAVRLAHSVNKEIIFALVDTKKIDYIRFGRLRP